MHSMHKIQLHFSAIYFELEYSSQCHKNVINGHTPVSSLMSTQLSFDNFAIDSIQIAMTVTLHTDKEA
jgi:hypothetical protein